MIALGRVILGEKQPRFGLKRATVKVSRIEIFVGLLKTLKVRSLTDVNILASFGARDPSSRDHCEERTRFSCKAVRVNFLLQAFRPIARRAPAFSFNRSAPLFSVSVSRSKAILCLELDHQHSWMKPKTNLVVFLIGVLSDLFGLTQLGLQDRRFVLLHV